MSIIHKFESAGLGKAPFRLIGMLEKRSTGHPDANGLCVGAPGQPTGTCDYCGTGIANCYQIQSADGKKFIVGSDCVFKTGDNGLVDHVKREAARLATPKRHEREKATIEEYAPKFELVIAEQACKPHPNEYHAKLGKTNGDYLSWMWDNSGTSGRMKLIRQWCMPPKSVKAVTRHCPECGNPIAKFCRECSLASRAMG